MAGKSAGQSAKRAAVKYVKPHVNETTWKILKDPRHGSSAAWAAHRHRTALQRMNLTELAQEFKTDKWGSHRYTPHYQRHLERWRNDSFTLLEIGIGGYARKGQGGNSLRMWKQFFPRAQIIGLDIQDKSFVDETRIKTYRGSQTDEGLLRRIVEDAGSVRVVIDDGSHRPEHIRETFRIMFPLIESEGMYIIEDTQTSYWPEWGGSEDLQDRSSSMALVKDLVDGLNYEEYVDDDYQPSYTDLHVTAVHAYHNLVFVQKGRNVEGTRRRHILRNRYANASPTEAAST